MIILDDMKKEGRRFGSVAILGYILSISILLFGFFTDFEKYSRRDVSIIFVFCFVIGTICLYSWLYALKYKLEITEDEVAIRTLFKRTQIYISEITNYTCTRYRKSVFYQFRLFTDNRTILVNTRYKNEFEELLANHKIEKTT